MWIAYVDDSRCKHLAFINKSDLKFYKDRFGGVEIETDLMPPKENVI